MRLIHSLNELPQDERIAVRSFAIKTGLVTCFVGVAVLYALGVYPFTMETGFAFFITVLLSFNPPILLFAFGYAIAQSIKLNQLGYAMPTSLHQPYSNTTTTDSALRSVDIHTYHPTTMHHTSMSINPASGLPMSGNSGIDCRGNPYGTLSYLVFACVTITPCMTCSAPSIIV